VWTKVKSDDIAPHSEGMLMVFSSQVEKGFEIFFNELPFINTLVILLIATYMTTPQTAPYVVVVHGCHTILIFKRIMSKSTLQIYYCKEKGTPYCAEIRTLKPHA
jgi:Na+/H+ antiporter NhaA